MALDVWAIVLVVGRSNLLGIALIELLVVLGCKDVFEIMLLSEFSVLAVREDAAERSLACLLRILACLDEFAIVDSACHTQEEGREPSWC